MPPTTIHAMAFDRYGPADVLSPTEVELPEPGPGQLRIAVRTAGVNPLDHKIRRGELTGMFPIAFPHVPGVEGAGVVEETGPGVDGFSPGDEVFGWTLTGSYARHALVEAHNVALRPRTLGWIEAAAIPTAAETAVRCFEYLRIREGETLLLHAAAGGVGTLAVQLAVARGVQVIGTASEANHAFLRSLGATPVVYGDGLADRVRAVAPQGVDAALDAAGRGGALETSIALTGGTERVVTIADGEGSAEHGVHFSGGGSESSRTQAALAEALALHRAGSLHLPIHRVHALADAAEAHRTSEQGHLRGKVVLVAG